MNDDQRLVDMTLQMMKYIGIHPFQNKWFLMLQFIASLMRIVAIGLTIHMIFNNFGNLAIFMDGLNSSSSFMQGITKVLPILFHKDKLQHLITGMTKFRQDGEINKYSFWMKTFTFYRNFLFFTLLALVVISLSTQKLLFESTMLDIPFGYPITLLGQYVLITNDATAVVAMDLFFLAACLIIRNQFLILKREIASIDYHDDERITYGQLRNWIKHHEFMLRYTKDLAETYTSLLLLQYGLSMYSIFIQLVFLTENNGIIDIVKAFFYIMSIIFQISVYCFPADEISNLCSEVAMFCYDIKWYNFDIRFQKTFPVIICRAQRPVLFRAGNMLGINREAVTTIFKGSVSFYTLIMQVKQK